MPREPRYSAYDVAAITARKKRHGIITGVGIGFVVAVSVVILFWPRGSHEEPWVFDGTPPEPIAVEEVEDKKDPVVVAATQWPELHTSVQQMLTCVQGKIGRPLVITSGFRPGDKGLHGTRRAVDIRATIGSDRAIIGKACLDCGAVGLGVYDRHVHCDTRTPPPVWWGGVSR